MDTYGVNSPHSTALLDEEPISGPNQTSSKEAGAPAMLRSFGLLLVLAFLGTLVLPGLAYNSSPANGSVVSPPVQFLLEVGAYCVFVLAALAGFHALLRRLEPRFQQESRDQAVFLETISGKFVPAAIATSAGLSLFLELAVIRWQGTIFEFFAFYKNYGLLACFAGLGLGYALSQSKDGVPLNLTLPLLSWQFILLIALRYGLPNRPWGLETTPFSEQLNMGFQRSQSDQIGAVYLLLTVVFLLTALAFLPVGQLCGRLMERRNRLSAYGWNLLGSALGASLTFLVASLWTPPIVWFGVCFVSLLIFLARKPKTLLFGIVFAMLAMITLAWPANRLWNKIYSPYQLLEVGYDRTVDRTGLMIIRAAGHYYQRVYDLSNAVVDASADPELHRARDHYDLPFRIHPGPNDVAIVGAGSGNDVAAALRSGARHVDAIEIDPAIQLLGKATHPERPYDDPRVRPIINDARTFFRNATGHYDTIVYGLLDSHTLLSHASSVRLDSFVYTVEGLREARSRLKENGVLSLSFSVLNDAMGTKIFHMMREAFGGKEPLVLFDAYEGSVIFVQSKNGDLSILPAVLSAAHLDERSAFYRNSGITVDSSTDDWPFFYMPRRVYPVSYLVVLGLILLLSFVLYASFFRGRPAVSHLPFFFLGVGFMLVETKAITEMGLTFGNTWEVIAVAITSILAMALLGNGLVHRFRVGNPLFAYFFLFASLAVGWWIAKIGGLPSTIAGRIGTAVILTCPLFFSGIVFSALLSAQTRISTAMSLNLIGAMCGGILEYNSMYFGFRFLYLLAAILYAMALLSGLAFRIRRSLPAWAES
jgi:hypothetical protein